MYVMWMVHRVYTLELEYQDRTLDLRIPAVHGNSTLIRGYGLLVDGWYMDMIQGICSHWMYSGVRCRIRDMSVRILDLLT